MGPEYSVGFNNLNWGCPLKSLPKSPIHNLPGSLWVGSDSKIEKSKQTYSSATDPDRLARKGDYR